MYFLQLQNYLILRPFSLVVTHEQLIDKSADEVTKEMNQPLSM